MAKRTGSFNETHDADSVIRGRAVKGLPSKPEEIDLRFLFMISFGDTYNGSNNPSDGTAYTAVLYGNQIAWDNNKWYWHGSREQGNRSGDELYRRMYHASQLYMKIMEIGRALFFRDKLKKGVDTLFVSADDLVLLEDHPQWKEMLEDFGLRLEPVVGEISHFKVVVTKFYEPPKEVD